MANRLRGWEDRYLHNGAYGIGRKSRLPPIRPAEKKNINLIEREPGRVSPSQLNKINSPTQLTRIDEEKPTEQKSTGGGRGRQRGKEGVHKNHEGGERANEIRLPASTGGKFFALIFLETRSGRN